MVFGRQVQVFAVFARVGAIGFHLFFPDLVGTLFTNDIGNYDFKFLAAFVGHKDPDQMGIILLVQLCGKYP